MPRVVKLQDGRLFELTVPGLLVVRKIGGTWTTVKPLAGINLHPNGWIDTTYEGWYIFNGKDRPEFLPAGTFVYKFTGKKRQFMTGPWP